MNYRKEIEDLKEKIYYANSNNVGNDEQLLREMKNEILLKQVLLRFNKIFIMLRFIFLESSKPTTKRFR